MDQSHSWADVATAYAPAAAHASSCGTDSWPALTSAYNYAAAQSDIGTYYALINNNTASSSSSSSGSSSSSSSATAAESSLRPDHPYARGLPPVLRLAASTGSNGGNPLASASGGSVLSFAGPNARGGPRFFSPSLALSQSLSSAPSQATAALDCLARAIETGDRARVATLLLTDGISVAAPLRATATGAGGLGGGGGGTAVHVAAANAHKSPAHASILNLLLSAHNNNNNNNSSSNISNIGSASGSVEFEVSASITPAAAASSPPALAAALAAHTRADTGGYTPLHLAALSGHAPSISLLLAAKAAVDAPSARGGLTALMLAVQKGHADAAAALLAAGADRAAVDRLGISVASYARASKRYDLMAMVAPKPIAKMLPGTSHFLCLNKRLLKIVIWLYLYQNLALTLFTHILCVLYVLL